MMRLKLLSSYKLGLLLSCITLITVSSAQDIPKETRLKRANEILEEVPLVDGHNDLAYFIRNMVNNRLQEFPFEMNLTELEPWASKVTCHTDLPRLRAGQVGGQFWSAYVPCDSQYKNAVTQTLEQIDVIKRLAQKYPDDLEFVTTADGIVQAHAQGKIASMIGLEGGHSMDSSLGNLRVFYNEGVRYMTLSHSCNTPWVDNSGMEYTPEFGGLTPWGEIVVKEMNRLGMFVDISHVASQTMRDVLDISRAPVIFSHSSARALRNHTRNVPDDVLQRMAENGGVVMVTFVTFYLTNRPLNTTIQDIIAHINHVRDVAGVDHVGLGGDYNGAYPMPIGMEDVSKYPDLFAELMLDPRWTDEDLKKLAGNNLIRAFQAMEKVRDDLSYEVPYEESIPAEDIADHLECVNEFSYFHGKKGIVNRLQLQWDITVSD